MSDQAAPPDAPPQGQDDLAIQQLAGPAPLVGPGAPPLTDGSVPVDVIALTHNLLRAIDNCAKRASADADPRDAKELGAAALAFSQAVITLDPSRLKGGDTPNAQRASMPITPPNPPVTDRNHNGQVGE